MFLRLLVVIINNHIDLLAAEYEFEECDTIMLTRPKLTNKDKVYRLTFFNQCP